MFNLYLVVTDKGNLNVVACCFGDAEAKVVDDNRDAKILSITFMKEVEIHEN